MLQDIYLFLIPLNLPVSYVECHPVETCAFYSCHDLYSYGHIDWRYHIESIFISSKSKSSFAFLYSLGNIMTKEKRWDEGVHRLKYLVFKWGLNIYHLHRDMLYWTLPIQVIASEIQALISAVMDICAFTRAASLTMGIMVAVNQRLCVSKILCQQTVPIYSILPRSLG